jgi:hypothetical protein
VIDTTTADPQDDGLTTDAEPHGAIDHFLALRNRPPCRARRTKSRPPAATLRSSHAAAFHITERTLDLWLIECRLSPLTQDHFALVAKVCSPPIMLKNSPDHRHIFPRQRHFPITDF